MVYKIILEFSSVADSMTCTCEKLLRVVPSFLPPKRTVHGRRTPYEIFIDIYFEIVI